MADVAASAVAHLDSIDPASGDVIGRVQCATPKQVRRAVEEARHAQEAWAQTDVRHRARVLRRFMDIVLADDEATLAITRESGKPLVEAAMADLLPTLDQAKFLCKMGPRLLARQRVRLGNPLLWDRRSHVQQVPRGVIGVIAPWNYPVSIPAAGVLPALFAGNGVVLKPSEHTPLLGKRFAGWLHDAGVPHDLLQVVHGRGDVGSALAGSDVDGLLFTGSVPTGQKVAAAASKRFTPCCLELGGKDPMIVLADVRLDLAVRGALWGAFTNAGQTCASIERAFVHPDLCKRFVAQASAGARLLRVGPGTGEVDMGPLIDDRAVERVARQIRQAEKQGATLECGGEVLEHLGPRFLAPTVLSGVSPEMQIMQEETFGPTLPVMAAEPEVAVGMANASPYGLTASVWSRSRSDAMQVAARLQAGTVTLNDHAYTYAAATTPWGGVKASGVGTSHSGRALEEVTQLRHTNTAPGGRRRSSWYFPYDGDLHRLMERGLPFLYGRRGRLRLAPIVGPFLRRR